MADAGANEIKPHKTDNIATKLTDVAEKTHDKVGAILPAKKKDDGKSKDPPGGVDKTTVPHAPLGYTVKFTYHKAINLPFADLASLSSDPYLTATLRTRLQSRHKQDPDITWRTPTIHRTVEPVWNSEHIVANVPGTGFDLKLRLYDEDPADHDDRLGNVRIEVDNIDENWSGIREQEYEIQKRSGSKRAYTLRGCAAMFSHKIKLSGSIFVSIEVLGKTEANHGGRLWTIGPCTWIKHYSPMIGRLTGTKAPGGKGETQKYNFQANQIQLAGPVPEVLYHRYVEFKPFVKGMFTGKSLQGRILNRALHHQHARIYNFDSSTDYGTFEKPDEAMTMKFLNLAHYDRGGRIFTYVITLDGKWRFTETGKEFGIDLLSKHTMHSDVNIYIAYSGEFFIRRLKQRDIEDAAAGLELPQPDPENHADDDANEAKSGDKKASDKTTGASQSQPVGEAGSAELGQSQARTHHDDDLPQDPASYALVIDNDSGTYRPSAELLSNLKDYLRRNLPGLRIVTLDCMGDKEKMDKWKQQQRDRKKAEGRGQVIIQDDDSSISSSDISDLDAQERLLSDEPEPSKRERMEEKLHLKKRSAEGEAKAESGHLSNDPKTTTSDP